MNDVPQSALRRSRGPGGWILALLVLAGVGGFIYWRVAGQPRVPPPAVAEAPPPPPVVDAGAPAPTLSITDGDALLRAWQTRLSSASELGAWLAGDDLIRRVVATVALISNGESPRRMMPFIEIAGPFEVEKRKRKLFVSPKGYARYDGVTGVVASIDMGMAAKAYVELRPYLDAAYAEVGQPGRSFDEVMNTAVERLTNVTVPNRPPRLVEKGALYAYADPKLEGLSAAEKHLLRMGPKNARKLQEQLRAFQAAVRAESEAGTTAQHSPTPSPSPSEEPGAPAPE